MQKSQAKSAALPDPRKPGSLDDVRRHAQDSRSRLDAATSSGLASALAGCELDHTDAGAPVAVIVGW
jgi:hypothetical protein